jgi:protoporphyrinogen IX oxidase
MAYLWFKSFHIMGFVAWFAGLFYLPRLFVYHIEADTLLLVLLLIGFHFYCGRVIHQLKTGNCSTSGLQMRRINEIPTILLALVVLLAIFKNHLPINTTVLGTLITVLLFAVVIQVYARRRRLQQQKDSVLSVSD